MMRYGVSDGVVHRVPVCELQAPNVVQGDDGFSRPVSDVRLQTLERSDDREMY